MSETIKQPGAQTESAQADSVQRVVLLRLVAKWRDYQKRTLDCAKSNKAAGDDNADRQLRAQAFGTGLCADELEELAQQNDKLRCGMTTKKGNMRKRLTKLTAAIAVTCSALFSAPGQQIVLLRTYMTTNTIPGYVGGPPVTFTVDTNGIARPNPVNAVAITYPPRTEITTNYVLGYREGTNSVELVTVTR